MSDVESLQSREVTRSPVDGSQIGLPAINKHLAIRRISQVGGQFESPTRHSRRSFLKVLGLGVAGIATGGVGYALTRNDASAASTPAATNTLETTRAAIAPPALESKKEPLNLAASEIFGNNVTTVEKLKATPDRIKDFKLVTDSQGNVLEIIVLGEDDKRTGAFVTRIMFDSQAGRFRDGFQTTPKPISISAESIVKVGRKIIIGGQTEWSSHIPTLLESSDSVRPFEQINLTSTNLVTVAEMVQIPNTSKVILVGGTYQVIFDAESRKTVETLSKSGTGVVITSTPADTQTASLYSRSSNGLSSDLVNLTTGQVLNNQLYFDGVYVEGYSLIKDANKKDTHILGTDNENQQELVLDLATNIVKAISYKGSIDRIPLTKKSMLFILATSVINNWIWEVGGITDGNGGGSLVILNRPLLSDPNIDPRAVNVYLIAEQQSGGISQQNLKRGIFGGKPGFLTNFEGFGLVFIETKQDGSPVEGAGPVYLSIKDKDTPGVKLPIIINP